MKYALMIDLETYGLHPISRIAQFGYALADLSKMEYLSKGEFWLKIDPGDVPATMTPETIQWWMAQSQEARDRVFNPTKILDPDYVAQQTVTLYELS